MTIFVKKNKPTRKAKLKKLIESSFHNKSMFEHYQNLWAKEVGMVITQTKTSGLKSN